MELIWGIFGVYGVSTMEVLRYLVRNTRPYLLNTGLSFVYLVLSTETLS
jgi:hypothetical protein